MGKRKSQNKRFQYGVNRRKQFKNSKKGPDIKCAQVKAAWDQHKSTERNLADMGLSADSNKTLAIPTRKDLMEVSEVSLETLKALREKIPTKKAIKSSVVEDLEAEANIPQPQRLKLSDPDVEYATYMLEKYGEDYKAMARDYRNYYQDTPKQIKRKILKFKSIPAQYKAYLASKSQIMETA